MEGLSAAASGIAVVSVAVQLAESFKKLCDFWKSIEEAPENIRAISVDLELLSSVLIQIAHETQHVEPDATLIAALNVCCVKVKMLTKILNEIEPGFASTKIRVRKWTALKAVLKQGELMKFQEALDRLKGTLLLVQQNQHSRLSRNRQKSLERSLATITHNISSLSVQQHVEIAGMVPSIVSDHLRVEEQDVTDLCARKVYPAQSDHSIPGGPWSVPRRQTTVKRTLGETRSVMETFLGTIRAMSTTTIQTSRQNGDLTLYREQEQLEYNTSYTIYPALWLIRLGVHYGIHLDFLSSSTQGWKNALKPFCPVLDDSLIFEFCRQGNVPAVKHLLSKGHASVRDTDSRGYTPLHFAAQYYHPELCGILKSAGADMTTLTHGLETPIRLAADRAKITTHAMLSEVFDTFRLLIDSMDFFEEISGGWEALEDLCCAPNFSFGDGTAKRDLLLWMLQLLSFELKTNIFQRRYARMLFWTMISGPEIKQIESFDLLLNLGGQGTIDAVDGAPGGYNFLHRSLAHGWIEENYELSLIVARRPNLHRLGFDTFFTPYGESPTSLAMYISRAFTGWLHALAHLNVDLERFIDQELEQNPELYAGWEKETLLDLFLNGDRPDLHVGFTLTCRDCFRDLHGVEVQPYWRHLLEMFKEKRHPKSPAPADSEAGEKEGADSGSNGEAVSSSSSNLLHDSDTMGDVPLDNLDETPLEPESKDDTSKYSVTTQIGSGCLYSKDELVCIDCWLHYERTGTRAPPRAIKVLSETEDSSSSDDSSENEYSPYLIHT